MYTKTSEQNSPYATNWNPPKRPVPEVKPGQVYGDIACIPADEIHAKRTSTKGSLPWGFWRPFLEEIQLRLECTPRHEALRIPFTSAELARRARYVLRESYERRFGRLMIEVRQRDHYLFVRRGKNWGKASQQPDPELAALSD